jgi:multisubunit Na+/H+ antiporter MnhF subunit
MWLAVMFDAIWGPDFVSTSTSGSMTRIPSAIVLAIFAYLGTRVVARYGFGHHRE